MLTTQLWPTPGLNCRADYLTASLRFSEQGLLTQEAIGTVRTDLAQADVERLYV